jgi:L-ascorbate metabolism protein UlaG (beta-lactamase superfamily)
MVFWMVESAMEIRKVSAGCWQIKTKKEVVLVDPDKETKLASRIVVHTQNVDGGVRLEDDSIVIIAGPGEYEVGGVEVAGFNGGGAKLFTVTADGVTVGIFGELTEAIKDKKLEKLDGIDVLVVRIGYKDAIAMKDLVKIAKDIGTNYLIPMGYNDGDESLKKFLDETDNEGLEAVESLKVEKESLPEGMEIVILK